MAQINIDVGVESAPRHPCRFSIRLVSLHATPVNTRKPVCVEPWLCGWYHLFGQLDTFCGDDELLGKEYEGVEETDLTLWRVKKRLCLYQRQQGTPLLYSLRNRGIMLCRTIQIHTP